MKTIKKILRYLLNKTGHFIIIDVGEINPSEDWTHHSFNVSFWEKKKTLVGLYKNGEVADIEEFGLWSRLLNAEEIKSLHKSKQPDLTIN